MKEKQVKRVAVLLLSFLLLFASAAVQPVAAADSAVPLSSLTAGDTVNFAGCAWIVLDPDSGYLLMKDVIKDSGGNPQTLAFDSSGPANAVFDPSSPTNVACYLNDTFYDSLTPGDRALIQSHSWTTGNEADEASGSVDAKIGLLSYSEWFAYCDVSGVRTWDCWWLRTPNSGYPVGSVWNIEVAENPLSAPAHLNSYNSVRPALYLDPGSQIAGGNVIGGTTANALVNLSSLAVGDTVNFAGYDWIVLDPAAGYLLMRDCFGSSRAFDSAEDPNWNGSTYNGTLSFDPGNPYNIAWYLNSADEEGGFINSLLNSRYAADAALIKPHGWAAGPYLDEASLVADAEVGLLSRSEYEAYESIADFSAVSSWLITPAHYSGGIYLIRVGSLFSADGNHTGPYVQPALYLNPGVKVAGGSGGEVIGGTYEYITATSGSAEGGSVSGGGAYQSGDTAVLTAVPEAGWNFTGWVDESGASLGTDAACSLTMGSACRTVAALFRPAPVITVVNGASFIVTVNDTGGILTGSYAGTYGTVIGSAGGSNGNVLSGTLNGLDIGTPTEIPVGSGVIMVVAADPPGTTLDSSKGFY